MATILVDVVSAESSVFSGEAKFVALPGQEGELGIMPGHVPLITRIKPGEVRIETSEGTKESLFVAGGFLEVQPDRVTVLSDIAVRTEELDEQKAQAAIEAVKKEKTRSTGDIDLAKVQAELAMLAAQVEFIKKRKKQ